MKAILNEKISSEDIYDKLKQMGYRGSIDDIALDLLSAFQETSAYSYDPRDMKTNQIMTENEYFKMMSQEINKVIYGVLSEEPEDEWEIEI